MKKENRTSIQKIDHNIYRVLLWILILILLSLIPSQNYYFSKIDRKNGIVLPKKINLPKPPDYPVNKNTFPVPEIGSKAIFIQDIDSGVVLYQKNPDERLAPASTTKIITALVAMDTFPLDTVMTVKREHKEARSMDLFPGERITLESLLYGALVHSANDAALAIADNYPGGYDVFIKKMNEKVASLGLKNTRFSNPIGYDDINQYTTARDLARQALEGIKNKSFSKIVSTRDITVSDEDFTKFHSLNNVNELLGKIPGVAGVKTGFTQNAGEILVSEVKKNGRSLIIVVLNTNDRFGDTKKLISWVFDNFEWVSFEKVILTNQG